MFVLCINVRIFSSSSRLSSGVVMENILGRFWNDNCECGGKDCVAGGSYWCMKRGIWKHDNNTHSTTVSVRGQYFFCPVFL